LISQQGRKISYTPCKYWKKPWSLPENLLQQKSSWGYKSEKILIKLAAGVDYL